jgi:hypothetical protein
MRGRGTIAPPFTQVGCNLLVVPGVFVPGWLLMRYKKTTKKWFRVAGFVFLGIEFFSLRQYLLFVAEGVAAPICAVI